MPEGNFSSDFNPQSHNAMFATIIAEMKADRMERTEFRNEVRSRFKEGTQRMNGQDVVLSEIKEQTLKTNGRVTKLEGKWKIVTAKIVGALMVLAGVLKALVWLYENGFRVTH